MRRKEAVLETAKYIRSFIDLISKEGENSERKLSKMFCYDIYDPDIVSLR